MTARKLSLIVPLAFLVHRSLGGPAPEAVAQSVIEPEWEFSISTSTYLVRNGPDYANPNVTADRDWLHLEARYNYEALRTGSIWLGYNFSFGEKLVFEATPMLGGVFGDVTGIAPGYSLSLTYEWLSLSTQGEYFFDSGSRGGNFFYTWTELNVSPVHWLHAGFVIDRTKAFGSSFDIRRGPLLGFTYQKFDFTTYWLSPGSHNSAVVFAATISF